MSEKRAVIMATVVLNSTDFREIERIARAIRAVYETEHERNPQLVEGGYVVAVDMDREDTDAIEARLMKMATSAAAEGAPVESSNPVTAKMFARVANAKKQ